MRKIIETDDKGKKYANPLIKEQRDTTKRDRSDVERDWVEC